MESIEKSILCWTCVSLRWWTLIHVWVVAITTLSVSLTFYFTGLRDFFPDLKQQTNMYQWASEFFNQRQTISSYISLKTFILLCGVSTEKKWPRVYLPMLHPQILQLLIQIQSRRHQLTTPRTSHLHRKHNAWKVRIRAMLCIWKRTISMFGSCAFAVCTIFSR